MSASGTAERLVAPVVCRTAGELLASRIGASPDRAVVMTMGALHEGHRALMRAARTRVGPGGQVLVTIFVNPLQFGAGEDLARYPRTWQADLEACRQEGVDVVFAPESTVIYPHPPQVLVDPGSLAAELEGAVRPGHFRGVLTVVLKLLHLTAPAIAAFGEKDYQQLVLVGRMVADLDVPVEVVAVPTVREPDGLALSSRNRYLTPPQRVVALSLSAALAAGAAAAGGGAAAALRAAREVWEQSEATEEDLGLDYLVLRSPDLGASPDLGPARLLVAARVGSTRLIDNAACHLGVG